MDLSREQARALDRRAMEELGIPGIVLMENAGRGMAELLLSLGAAGPVAVCCGKGNNGGDGLVIARHLANAGVTVRVLLFADPARLPADAATNFTITDRMSAHDATRPGERGRVSLEVLPGAVDDARLAGTLAGADWVVDALFGSGLRGPVPAPFDGIIAAINAAGARVLAVDIPSGLDSDTGSPSGPAVRADHTATVVAPKKGFGQPAATAWVGHVHVIGMGTPVWLLEEVTEGERGAGTAE
jgi:NAD(P)H-hydrate epimerase